MPTTETKVERAAPPWTLGLTIFGTLLALAVLFGWQLLVAGLDAAGVIEIEGALGLFLPWGHLLMGLVVVWLVRRSDSGLAAIGFRSVPALRALSLYLQALLLGYTAIFVSGIIIYALSGRGAQPNLLPVFGTGREALIAAALSAGLIAPITEEMLFRGFLFTGLRGRFGLAPALLLSSLAFALIHFNPYAFPALLALGALLAWLFDRSGSLWLPIAFHMTINIVTLLLWYAQANGLFPAPP